MLQQTKKTLFSGVCTALITPFHDGQTDEKAFRRLCRNQLDAGVNALLVCGTTGESPTLTEIERQRLIAIAAEEIDGRIPLLCGSGSNSHEKTMRFSRDALRAGADALLVVTPYYNKGTPRGIVDCFRAVASLGSPVILYNIPSRTGVDADLDILKQLSKEENIVAVKECAGLSRIDDILCEYGNDFDVYTGNDSECLPALSLGAKGVISVSANVFPQEVCALVASFRSGKKEEALRLHKLLHRFHSLLFAATNPSPVKYAASLLSLCENSLRLPMTEADEGLCRSIAGEMKKIRKI